MQKKLIAIAAAAMGLSSSAFALGPSSLPAQYTIYAAGGSAQAQAAIFAADQLMNNVDSYSTDGCNGKDSGSYRVFFGTLKAAVGSAPAGAKVLMYYKFSGGSYPNGVFPQGTGATLPFPSNVAGSTACSGQAWPKPTFAIPATPTVDAVPDWGLADVETKLLNNPYNVPAGGSTLTAAQAGNIANAGIYVNVFGVAVSNNVFTANAGNGSCKKTNFTKAEMNGVLGGTITDWSQLQGDGGCSIAAGPIVLLDRASGSGSKASGSLYFLGYPSPGYTVPGSVSFGYTTAATGGRASCNGSYEDVAETSNGNIGADIQLANNTGTNVGNCRAVAVLGAEFPPGLNGGGYSFTTINGVDPGLNGASGGTITYDNELSGAYDFQFTNSFNYRTHAVGSNPQHYKGDGTAYSSLIDKVKSIMQQNNIASGVTGSPSTAPSGVLLDPNSTGGFTQCTSRVTHFGTSQAPAQLIVGQTDFSVPAPAACVDHL
jgi:hypothetical protein